jgi:membrane-anchored protein YejM (alkaline phosphatase superfamily)
LKISSLSELKKELQQLPAEELVDLCTALAKYKKDNKEYLDYLLYSARSKPDFIKEVKVEIDFHYSAIDKQANLYFIKKNLRKILRLLNKYCKYLGDKTSMVELHIYFCRKLKDSGIPFRKSQMIVNLYEQELKKIDTLVRSLHEDLRADYGLEIEEIRVY